MKHHVIWLDSVDSTNDEAKRQIDSLMDMSVLAAHEQTSGRGQRGNTWLSSPGMNLTFSIVLKYGEGSFCDIRPADQSMISQMISMTMVELLSRYGIEAWIKLPNDIYVGDKKICGILIEHALKGSSLLHTIVGVGLNVNQRIFDPSLPNPTSMALEKGDSKFDLESLLVELLDIFISKGTSERFFY